jgi:superoxide reductase
MKNMNELYKSADWREEKHVPVIDAPDTVKSGEFFNVNVTVGKAVAHPNTTAHHIGWIEVYFQPEGGKFPYQVGKLCFDAHGASVDGADTSTVYTNHGGNLSFKTGKPGTIVASSYCNIHGLWQNAKEIKLG